MLISVIIPTYNRITDVGGCIESVLNSEIRGHVVEIILVDNASTDGTGVFIASKYPTVNIIRSEVNLMAGGGRNLGASRAKGELLVFIDSDNVLDKCCLAELTDALLSNDTYGMVGPKMLYYERPEIVWYAGATINLVTSKTKYTGLKKRNESAYDCVYETGHVPNLFMLRKSVWEQVGGIDVDYVMHYEESDLAEKVRRCDYKIVYVGRAGTYHKIPVENDTGREYAISNTARAYYTARNRIIFMKKNASPAGKLVFTFIFLPLFTALYILVLIKLHNIDVIKAYLKGIKDGLVFKNK